MRFLALIVSLFLSTQSFADAVVFNGDFVKTLKDQVNLFDTAYILTGTSDPMSVATSAPKGSLYLRQTPAGNGALYVKLDNGSSTNWAGPVGTGSGDVSGPGSSTDNALVRFDGTTGKTIKNSLAILDNSGNLSGVADFTATGTVTINTGLTGPLKATAGVVSAGAINLASSEVTGVLPVANGGTNSSTALSNNRVMQSSGGKIQEAAAITASRALASDANGIPVASATTATELGYVNGVTSSIQTQLDGKEPTITVLPVAKGGTNSSTALNNNRVIQSSGGKIQEAAAITASRALASDANGIPVAATTTATELGYVNGVTSSIQTQLDTKAIGAASSTTNAVPSFSGTDGKTLQNTAAILTTGGALSGVTQLDVDNVRVDGNTVSTTNSNGNLVLTPNGTGRTTTSKGVDFTAASGFRLYDTDDSNYVEFKPNGTTTGNYTQTWPAAQPIAETSLKDNGSGDLKSDFISTEVNLILNAFAAQDTNGYTASGAGIAVARTTTASDLPLGSIYGSALKITPSSGTDYVSYCFTLPEALASTKLQAQWQQRPLSGYASGDLKFDVYSYAGAGCTSTATRVALSTDSSGVTAIPNATGTFRTTFDTSTTAAAPSYQIRFVRVAGTTAINFTNISVGPGVTAQGAVVTPWQSFTPTLSWTTNATNVGYWRRVGSEMEMRVMASYSGASSAGDLLLTMPTGYTIDASAIPGNSFITNMLTFGYGSILDNGTNIFSLNPYVSSSTVVGFKRVDASGTYVAYPGGVDATTPITIASGDKVHFYISVPIAEWAGSGTVNLGSNDTTFISDDGTNDVFGPGGSAVPNQSATTGVTSRTFAMPSPQVQNELLIEIYNGSGWTDVASAFPFVGGNNNNANNFYGVRGFWASSTTFTVQFGNQGDRVNTTGADAGSNSWATHFSAGYRFRVRYASPGQAVGFGLATATQSGLISAEQNGSVSSTFTFNGSGGTSGSTTISYSRVGKVVTITVAAPQATTGTSSTLFTANTAIDSWARPSATVQGGIAIVENNAYLSALGVIQVDSSGIVYIKKTAAGTAWTNTTANSGLANINSFSYVVP